MSKHTFEIDIENTIYKALNPINTGDEGVGELEYMSTDFSDSPLTPMRKFLLDQPHLEAELWQELETAPQGSEEELKASRNLALLYLAKQATRVVQLEGIHDPHSQSEADEFTKLSVEIYGSQPEEPFNQQIKEDIRFFESLLGNESVDQVLLENTLQFYRSIKGAQGDEAPGPEVDTSKLESLREEFANQFSEYVSLIDEKKLYSAEDVALAAEELLTKLQLSDARWASWCVKADDNSGLSVNAKEQVVYVGSQRAPQVGSELAPTLTHEFFVHALRNINAKETEDQDLMYGLTGYGAFEEGLGQLFEYLYNGKTPSKIANRLLAAGLSLGVDLEKGLDKNEVFDVLKARTELILQADGVSKDGEYYKAKISELKTLIVNRFFRGGTGLEGGRAVYTKDIMYAEGYSKAITYVREQIDSGVSPSSLLEYLLSSKFDPTNPVHIERLKKHGIVLQK